MFATVVGMRTTAVTSLVLMNLAALGGCRPAEGEPTATATAITTATATASAPASATATPSATVTATASASATATATASVATVPTTKPSAVSSAGKDPSKIGKTCRTEADCGGYYCALGFNGANFSKTGTCQAQVPIYEGRPLVVSGEARVAAAIGLGSDHPKLVRMRAAALEEHASIAAFARTLCELTALGAPTWLLGATARALADEVRHADDTFAWVERLGGGTWRPGPLPEAVAPLRAGPGAAADLYRDVFRGGAVGETLAAARAGQESVHGENADLRAFHAGIAEDEARHAALAFRTLQWLGERFPELAVVRDEEIAAFRRSADGPSQVLLEPLLATLRA